MRRLIFEDEHEQFRESVRGFLSREAAPRAAAWQAAGIIDRDFWELAAAQGLVGLAVPERYGGSGVDDFRFNAVLDEEVVRTGATTDAFGLTNDVLTPYLVDLTDEEQRRRWLPGLTDGSIVPAIAMTEPGAGSDLRGIAATATWDGDAYLLSGSKTFVTSGIQADLVIVAAQVRREGVEGVGLFAVEAGSKGFERGRKLEKVGRRAQDTAELFFDKVRVPPENVIGEAGQGLALLMRNLAQERLGMAVTALASAERALAITLDYAREREAFGQPIGRFQANKFSLAEMSTEVAVGRAFVDRCIEAHVGRELSGPEAAGAKYWATELEFRVIDRCLQLHGGYGYMEEYEISRLWRDSRVQRIYGGTTEIMKEIVGRSLGL
ncbi:MAG TPA: acyl-CoA dehydrogenase family protein [Solirubrobacterales bacterium]|nr:acyl-CoA dehydrogenase family protein [Solirubrobacterales bacterium]